MTTAAGVCAMVELFASGKLPQRGFIRQEESSLADYLKTRAGALLEKRGEGDDLGKWTKASAASTQPV